MRSAADASWASCARHRFRPGILSFLGTQRLLHGCRSLHIVYRLIHIGEKPGLTCCVVQSRSEAFRSAARTGAGALDLRSEEHTSELQSRGHVVCRLLLAKKKSIKVT